jgi:hypothetical protein
MEELIHNSHQKLIHLGKISFSVREIKDIIKAWLAISFAFAIVMSGGFNEKLMTSFFISALTVGVGFIFLPPSTRITQASFEELTHRKILGFTYRYFNQRPHTPPTHSVSCSSYTIPSLANASSSGQLVKG